MKSSDLWKNLPSASELLENPKVRSLVDRLNPTVVTAQVRSLLDDVRAEVAQRADDARLPSLPELADRVGRYLSGADRFRVGGAINATGRFQGGEWAAPPLADAAVERMLLAAQDFTYAADGGPVDSDARQLLCELTGAEAAGLVSNHTAALQLAAACISDERRLLVARGEVGTIEPGCRLTEIASAAGATLIEVGAADSVATNDYEQALAGSPGVVLRVAAASDACRPPLEELIRSVKSAGGTIVVELGAAALAPSPALASDLPTVREAIGWGADLALVRGDGLIGGPGCGVVAGKRGVVEKLFASPLSIAARVDTIRAAAMAATLELHRAPEKAALCIPVLSLATAPIENLRSRAERIAALIAASGQVASAEAVEIPPSAAGGLPIRTPSWAIRLTPTGAGAGALTERLRSNTPPILGRIEGEAVILDLRTVPARHDLQLLSALEAEGGEGREDNPG